MLQSSADTLILGAGVSGLFAAYLSAQQGHKTLLIARGLGNLLLGAGDVAVGRSQTAASAQFPILNYQSPITQFQSLCEAAGYPFIGSLEHQHMLPTALGATRLVGLAPQSYVAGELTRKDEITLGRLPGFRDWYADLVVSNLNAQSYAARAVTLPLPYAPIRRDAFATDLARIFDNAQHRAEIAIQWRAPLKGAKRLGIPAILGLKHAPEAHRDLQDKLDLEIFEVPILPPSVPGMRLYHLLRRAIERHGGQVIIGPGVRGWIENGAIKGVIAETAGGPRHYAAQRVILATGGFRHGGLLAPAKGQVRETVFDLPIVSGDDWFAPRYWDAHPYAHFGLRVNDHMQPLNANGHILYPNLYAIGGILAGFDRLGGDGREGVDLATAWMAVKTNA
jgi:glycerol-3-phosphate dehydrogenase subunit B